MYARFSGVFAAATSIDAQTVGHLIQTPFCRCTAQRNGSKNPKQTGGRDSVDTGVCQWGAPRRRSSRALPSGRACACASDTAAQPRCRETETETETDGRAGMSDGGSADSAGARNGAGTGVVNRGVGNQVTVVLGAQWGDEGKGKVVDLLAQDADIVCRCQVRGSVRRAGAPGRSQEGRAGQGAAPSGFPAPRHGGCGNSNAVWLRSIGRSRRAMS
nr:PREDICTED: uncharacterized protein LOC107079319 [Lepisosteus oculatus]